MAEEDPCANCHGTGIDPTAKALEALGAVLPLRCWCAEITQLGRADV